MQTLGLSSESKRSDGRLKSLLWPTVENAWDVDYLGQQGFWICTVVAVLTLLSCLAAPNIITLSLCVISALFYFLAGMGVRQANWPAATLVLIVYALDILVQLAGHQMPNIIRILFAVVLFSNARAAFLASEWKPAAEGEDRPSRFNETLADKLVDQMPAKLWPFLEMPFLIFGIVMVLLNLLLLAVVLASRFGLLPHTPR
jgi:hypothetical protein